MLNLQEVVQKSWRFHSPFLQPRPIEDLNSSFAPPFRGSRDRIGSELEEEEEEVCV